MDLKKIIKIIGKFKISSEDDEGMFNATMKRIYMDARSKGIDTGFKTIFAENDIIISKHQNYFLITEAGIKQLWYLDVPIKELLLKKIASKILIDVHDIRDKNKNLFTKECLKENDGIKDIPITEDFDINKIIGKADIYFDEDKGLLADVWAFSKGFFRKKYLAPMYDASIVINKVIKNSYILAEDIENENDFSDFIDYTVTKAKIRMLGITRTHVNPCVGVLILSDDDTDENNMDELNKKEDGKNES